MDPRWTRRGFLHVAAGAAGAALVPGCAHRRLTEGDLAPMEVIAPRPLEGFQPLVSSAYLAHDERKASYDVFAAVCDAATDWSWLERGDRVLVKPALNSPNTFPATTDPWAVSCMVKLLKERGAGEVLVGDQSGVEHVRMTPDVARGSSRKLAKRTGLLAAIEEAGATPVFFEEAGWDGYEPSAPSSRHHWPSEIHLTRTISEVDHIVYLPRVASHAIGDTTLGIKLGVGFLRDDSRLALHAAGGAFHTMYAEINHVPEIASRLRLVVSSSTRVLATIGPDIGLRVTPEVGLILASESLLAHEILASAWLHHIRGEYSEGNARALDHTVIHRRAEIHRSWAHRTWREMDDLDIADIPSFRARNATEHPAAVADANWARGWPEEIHWELIGKDRAWEVSAKLRRVLWSGRSG